MFGESNGPRACHGGASAIWRGPSLATSSPFAGRTMPTDRHHVRALYLEIEMISVSFVVPAFNESKLITRCLQSIMTEARDIDYEIIVVDNGSTDETSHLAHLCGASVINEPKKGVTRARQAGLEKAQYELVAFIDADNDLPAGWLDLALKAMAGDGVVAASGPMVYDELRLFKRLIGFVFYLFAKVAHQIFPMLTGGNFIMKKSALMSAGGFNTQIDFFGDDTDTAKRLARVGTIKFDLGMWVYSSSRRMEYEGLFNTGARYVINYLWISLFSKVWSQRYRDIRPD
jgi:glycosyltransferase involved in cell wall biosynthesis